MDATNQDVRSLARFIDPAEIADLASARRLLQEQSERLAELARLLEAARQRNAELERCAPVAYLGLDPHGTIRSANDAALRLLGSANEVLVGQRFSDLLMEEDGDRFVECLTECRHRKESVKTELQLQGLDGRPSFVECLTRRLPAGSRIEAAFHLTLADLSQRKAVERAQRESAEWLELAQSAAGAGAWEWNLRTRRLEWSAGLFEVFGLNPDETELRFKHWLRRVHPDDRKLLRLVKADPAARGGRVDLEFRVVRPDGSLRWLRSQGRVKTDGAGTAERIIGLTVDVSDWKSAQVRFEQMQHELEHRTSEAEARTAELRAMSAELTHAEQRERRRIAELLHDELQQLLVAAKMRVGALRNEVASNEGRAALSQTEELLLDSLRATRSLAIELSPPVLRDQGLEAALCWLAGRMLDNHGLNVEVDSDGDIEPKSEEICILLFEIVRELLLNVVKHACTERAEIRLSRSDGLVQVVVRDFGIGFDVESLRGDGRTGGGFGLSNVRHRLELMGGRFELESTRESGTRVLLRAPATMHEDENVPDESCEEQSPDDPIPDLTHATEHVDAHRDRVRVLLADDHRMVREGLIALLARNEEIEIVGEASDGRMVVDLARALRPDVVVMDISMPEMTGIDATRIITGELSGVSIIGLSFHDEEDMAQAMLEAGAAAYLTKDRLSDDLVGIIHQAHDHRE